MVGKVSDPDNPQPAEVVITCEECGKRRCINGRTLHRKRLENKNFARFCAVCTPKQRKRGVL